MQRSYCTLFDKNYLPHLLSLYDSLERNIPDFVIYCFCMDDESFEYLQKTQRPYIIAISYQTLEEHFSEMEIAKANRTRVEYYFTCSSAICTYVFDLYPETELITYLDADLYFFSSPEPVYVEIKHASVAIIEHRFSNLNKRFEKYGKFNVGWVSFRNNENGRKCLEDWRKDCLEYCFDRLENGKFGDQKYLDYWAEKYSGVHIIQHLGANLAPWNVGQYKLKVNENKQNLTVNNQDLIFYHFASLKQINATLFDTNLSQYFTKLNKVMKDQLYIPYINSLINYKQILNQVLIVKNRKEYLKSSPLQIIKELSRNLRRLLFNDKIKITITSLYPDT